MKPFLVFLLTLPAFAAWSVSADYSDAGTIFVEVGSGPQTLPVGEVTGLLTDPAPTTSCVNGWAELNLGAPVIQGTTKKRVVSVDVIPGIFPRSTTCIVWVGQTQIGDWEIGVGSK